MVYFRKPAFWILAAAFTLYITLIFPRYGQSLFTYDSFYNVWRARKIIADPLEILRPDVMRRFSPLPILFLFLMDRFFGFNPWVYGWINGSLHMLNALLLFRLVRCLWGLSELPAALASIFFLFSSTQWGVLCETGQTHRLVCVSLSLLSLFCFLRFVLTKRRIDWLSSFLLFASTFGFVEDAVSLPLVLLTILFLFPARKIPWVEKLVLTTPFFFVSLICVFLSFSVKGPQGWALTLGPHVLVNLVFLVRELAQFLLIPRPEFVPLSGVPGILLRLVPAFLISVFLGILWRWKKDRVIDPSSRPFVGRLLIFGIAWIGITGLLYALRPMHGAWQGRYLYLPAVGEAIVVGMILYQIGRSLKALDRGIPVGIQMFLRGGFLGIVFYGLALNILTAHFMIRKSRSTLHAATGKEIPVVFSITSAIRDRYDAPLEIPPGMILVVEGLPLSIQRLKELLMIYYTSLPREIIEAKEGRPLTALPRSENDPILYMKWENQEFRVVSGLP